MAGIDLAALMLQVKLGIEQSNAGAEKISGFLAESALLTGASGDVYKQAAKDSALISQTETAAVLKTQAAKQEAGLKFGTDITKQNEVYTALSQTVDEAYKEQQATLGVIAKKQSTSILEDPVAWIMAQITLPQDIAKHNAADARRTAAFEQIQNLNAATSGTAQLQGQFANTVTVASAEAAARNAAAQATIAANNEALKGLSYNISGVKAVLEASQQEIQYLFSAKGAQNADEQLALSKRADARAAAADARAAQLFRITLADKQAEDKYASSVLDSINAGRVARGVAPLSGVKADTALSMIKSKSPLAAEFLEDYKTGERAVETGGKVILADTPAAMSARFAAGQTVKLAPEQEVVKKVLEGAAQKLTKDPTFASLKDDEKKRKYNEQVYKDLQVLSARVTPGDQNNPFAIAPLQSFKDVSTITSIPVWQKVFADPVSKGVDFTDPTRVIATVAEAVRKKEISYNEAVGLAAVYKRAVALNAASTDLQKFGIALPAKTALAYRTEVDLKPRVFGGSEIVDLTDDKQVGRALNTYLAQNADYSSVLENRKKAIQGVGAGFTGAGKLPEIPTKFGPNITYPPESGSIYNR